MFYRYYKVFYIIELFILLILFFSIEFVYMTLNTLLMDYVCNGIILLVYNYMCIIYTLNININLNIYDCYINFNEHIYSLDPIFTNINSMYGIEFNMYGTNKTYNNVNLINDYINNLKFIKIIYTSHTLLQNLNFKSEIPYIYTENNIPTLLFYKLINNTTQSYVCNTYYTVSPSELSYNIIKQQCFCMEEFILHANESLYLPILFYINLENLECTELSLDYYLVGYANT